MTQPPASGSPFFDSNGLASSSERSQQPFHACNLAWTSRSYLHAPLQPSLLSPRTPASSSCTLHLVWCDHQCLVLFQKAKGKGKGEASEMKSSPRLAPSLGFQCKGAWGDSALSSPHLGQIHLVPHAPTFPPRSVPCVGSTLQLLGPSTGLGSAQPLLKMYISLEPRTIADQKRKTCSLSANSRFFLAGIWQCLFPGDLSPPDLSPVKWSSSTQRVLAPLARDCTEHL